MTAAAGPVESHMRQWLERAVIGLELCPFAKPVYARQQVHFAVSAATDEHALLEELAAQLHELASMEPSRRETTLLVAPHCLGDFLDFNDFLGLAESCLASLGYEGRFQIASFHPAYQFAGTEPEDVTNCTNRAPYPTLHLLREESVERAVLAHPDVAAIYERNMRLLRELGWAGWDALGIWAAPRPGGS